ncbi:MAG TPA: ankyrin repeat domain-containing protein, partial [Candidatus Dependentiae bacterium]|nr:ankyrin repeat domain-containing protein [Candidatus Dependentiae bacterium]
RGAPVNAMDRNGYTALHAAVLNKHDAIVKLLLEKNPVINVAMPNGLASLHIAALNGHIDVVEFLLDHGIAVDFPVQDGRTALYFAAKKGCVDVVKLLLERGAPVNAMDRNGYTALHAAVLNKHDAIVKLLLEKNSVINVVMPNGLTSLHTAAFNGHNAIVQFLLDHGVAIDSPMQDGSTALHYAAQKGHTDVVKLLLARGASVNAMDQNGYTALHAAVLNKQDAIVELLLEKNPVINVVTPDGFTSLHTAAFNGHSAVVQFLLDHGVVVDILDKEGSTALHYAAQKGYAEVIKLLLEKGASINIVDSNEHTALHIAQLEHHSDVEQLLLNKGADLQILLNCTLYSDLISSVGQIKTHEERSNFLCKIFGINRCQRNFKLSYIHKLCEIANFLYLQNLWAKSITNIFFLYQELKKLEWSHGIIYNFVLLETNEAAHHLDDEHRFAMQQTMLIGTRNGIIAELNLIQCVMQEPFKFSQRAIKVIDEYLQSQDEEVKIIAYAIKQQYINRELFKQLFNVIKVCADRVQVSLLDNKLAHIYPIVIQMNKSFEFIQDITTKGESSPDILADIDSSEQFFIKLTSIMHFIEDSHRALERLYELIYSEKISLTSSDQSIKCSVAENVSMLPDKIYWPNRILSFDQYFSCNESQESPMLTTQIEPAAAASSAVGAASDGGWIPEVLKRNAAKQGNKHQVKPARKTRCKVAEHQYNPDDQRVTGKPAKPAASPAPSPADHLRQRITPVKPRSAKQESVKLAGYDKRVKRWFSPKFAQSQNKLDVLYHSFSPSADTFILHRGVRSPWQNRVYKEQVDMRYSLPGEIIFPDGTRRFVIFTCCLDPQGVCYHRGITYKT